MADSPDEEEDIERVEFDPEDAPSVLTTDLCHVYGCEKCPGIVNVGAIDPRSNSG